MSIKKPMVKLLGIQQLINEYQHHYQKSANKKSITVHQTNQNRYGKMFETANDKQSTLNKVNNAKKQMDSTTKIYTNKSFQFIQNNYHHSTIASDFRKRKLLRQSQTNQQTKKTKNFSSLVNFAKKSIIQEHKVNRKTSIKNKDYFLSSQPSLISSQCLIKPPSKSIHHQKSEKGTKNSSYLSLKNKNINFIQSSNGKHTPQLNLQNPTLASINKKIKQFEWRGMKKDQPSEFGNNIKAQQTKMNKEEKQNLKSFRISQTIENQEPSLSKDKQFVSIDTNYYGFSFKNKVPIEKSQKNKQSVKQQNSTLDKSAQDKQTIQPSQINIKKASNSTSNIQPSKKPYQTLNVEKKNRYQSTNLLKSKKPNSSLLMKPKLLLKDRYQLTKVIGRGMSGEVYQAKDILSDRYVVIKQIDINSIQYEFFREITHQNVIKYYNNFVENGKRYLVLQYFPMTLKDLLKDSKTKIDLTEDDLKHIFRSILNGLSYLHSLSIAHRDIKLDNIVISSDLKDIKFIDFGLCLDLSKLENNLSSQFCGTLSYLPPQIAQGQSHEPKKADIWSLGVVLYGLSLGRLPFKGRNESQILSKICKGKLIYPENYDSNLRDLIDKMLEKNPSKRLTVNQVISHQWLN